MGWAVPVTVVLVALSGCRGEVDKPTARLQGTVTIGGRPLPADAQASITFDPTDSGQANSAFVRLVDGKYDVQGVPLGKVQVTFSIKQPTGEMVQVEGAAPFADYRSLLPPGEAGRVIEVTGDNDQQNFDL